MRQMEADMRLNLTNLTGFFADYLVMYEAVEKIKPVKYTDKPIKIEN